MHKSTSSGPFLLTQKDGDLSTYFDVIDENEDGIDKSSLKQVLINNHITPDNRGITRGHLPLEFFFGFAKTLKKQTKDLDSNLRTSNRKRDILYTNLGDEDVNFTINSSSLFIPHIKPSPETQVYFNEAIAKTFTI